ncbi:MAG: leucine-rich repeat domain-containing protein [Bacilli bacterium]|nr:leucine-rich repeat domain-containing protein [Bacilli bacterium]
MADIEKEKNEQEQKEQDNKKRPWWVIIVILSLIAIIVVALLIILKGCSDNRGQTTTTSQPTTSETTSMPPVVSKYTIRYINNDGSVLKEYYEVLEGSNCPYDGPLPIYAGTDAEKIFYLFDNWDKDAINIQSDLTIKAIYKKDSQKKYHKYLNYDGSLLYDVTLNSGEVPTYSGSKPTKPESENKQFNFLSWDKTDNLDGTFTYIAQFESCTAGLVISGGKITNYDGNSTTVTIPETWNGQTITQIDVETFKNNNIVVEVTLPESITYIPNEAFMNCNNLETINLPTTNPLVIGDSAFCGCNNLTVIEIPDNTISIGINAFANTGLVEITLPDSVHEIEEHTFSGCASLTTVNLPDTLTVIKQNAFESCKNLENINLDYVKVIETGAFSGVKIKGLFLPSTIEYLANDVFNGFYNPLIYTDAEEPNPGWHNEFSGGANVCYGYNGESVGTDFEGIKYEFVKEKIGGVNYAALIDIKETLSGIYEVPYNITDDESGETYQVRDYFINSVVENEFGNFDLRDEFLNVESLDLTTAEIITIGSRSFQGLMLTSIDLALSIKQINYGAFMEINFVKEILLSIPNNVTHIFPCAFGYSRELIAYLPATVEYIGVSAFSSIRALYVSSNYRQPGWNSLFNTGTEDYTVYESNGFIYESSRKFWYSQCGSELVYVSCPNKGAMESFTTGISVFGSKAITTLGPRVFQNCPKLKTISITSKVTKISNCAIDTGYTSLSIWDSIVSVGKGNRIKDNVLPASAFSEINDVKYFMSSSSNKPIIAIEAIGDEDNYTIENECKIIYERCFSDRDLNTVSIPNSITEICSYAFSNTSITTINLPEGLIKINNHAFYGSKLSGSISLPTTLQLLDQSTFSNSNIRSINIPNSIYLISKQCFRNCTELEEVILNNAEFIEDNAFSECTSLRNVNLSSETKYLGGSSFYGCSSLKTIDLKNVCDLGHAAFSNSGLTSVVIPSSMTNIGPSSFSNCANLSSVTLNSNVEKISYSAFQRCGKLTEINLTSNINRIEYDAFAGSGLLSIYIPENVAFIGANIFSDCSELTEINCQASSRPLTWSKNFAGNCSAVIKWNVLP